MPKKEKPLPKPKSTPFGRKRAFENDRQDDSSLLADELAMAASGGKLEEFIKDRLPDSEQARKLAEMMMGMTGMMPPPVSGQPVKKQKETGQAEAEGAGADDEKPKVQPPDDVVNAVQSSDVKGLIDLLKREHHKRTGTVPDEVSTGGTASAPSNPPAMIEKQIIEELINISSSNGLSLDWVCFRPMKRYVEEYRKTGNL